MSICARIRARKSSAAHVASTFALPAPLRRPEIMWRSTPIYAPVAANAPPPSDALLRKLRALLMTYREAGGEHAVVLFHDELHGAPLIDALARFGGGLPAHVLPLAVHEVTQIGLEAIAALFAYGASAGPFLLRAKARHDVLGLIRTLALAEPILSGLGFGLSRIATIEVEDPEL